MLYCFESFLLFSDLNLASGRPGDPNNPDVMLNMNGGH